MKKVVLFLFIFTLIGCVEISTEPDWSKYHSSLKAVIDSNDCDKLQNNFNIAESNSDNQRARTGVDNYLLMEYIDNKMIEKSCY